MELGPVGLLVSGRLAITQEVNGKVYLTNTMHFHTSDESKDKI